MIAPRFWNALPVEVRLAPFLQVFHKIDTELFRQASYVEVFLLLCYH